MSTQFDYIVVGAGMAGASVAANLASHGRVAVLEAEEHAGYHTTGRSAALFSEIYGNRIIRALSRASRAFFFEPPREFAPTALVSPRSALHFVSDERLAALDAFRADEDVRSGTVALTAAQARELVPVFRAGYLGGAALEPGSADIEVDVLHQGFLRQARGAGPPELRGDPDPANGRTVDRDHCQRQLQRTGARQCGRGLGRPPRGDGER
jgi:D-arginine dehydrogenase